MKSRPIQKLSSFFNKFADKNGKECRRHTRTALTLAALGGIFAVAATPVAGAMFIVPTFVWSMSAVEDAVKFRKNKKIKAPRV